jgi:uncharacterized protein YmfQ (DUF2313 family)
MPVIQPSDEAYARMLKLLLPPSGIWRLDPDSNISKLMRACGDELERVSGRAADLIEEADPQTTTELLAEFERMLGLESTGTTAERRARVVALLVRRQRCRPADFQQALAPVLGQAVDDVVVIERGRDFAVAVGDDAEIFRFFVYRDPDLPGDYNIEDAQLVIDAMTPSHTIGHAIESIDFLCDDEFSLCDRDILGEAGAAGGAVGYALRKSAIAAFEAAVGHAPTLLFLGQEASLVTNEYVTASGTADVSTPTGVSEAFGTDAYDFDGSGGATWTCDDDSLAGVPTAESRAYFVILRARTLAAVAAICGKQDGVGEGFNFVFDHTIGFRLTWKTELSAVVNMDLTATSSTANQWRCLCGVFDRVNNEVRFASDLESETPVSLPAERIQASGVPLRIGDSRTPPSTLQSPNAEIGLIAEVQGDVSGLDPQTVAAALLAAFVA